VTGSVIRIEVERSGGFAGITIRKCLDTTELPADQAGELRQLVGGLDLDALCAEAAERRSGRGRPGPGHGGSDRFQYDVTIHVGGRLHRLRLGEADVPADLKPLLDRVLRPSGRD
jgi:hypothetical protein